MTITVAGEPFIGFLLASLRMVAWLVVVPPFSSRAVPVAAKTLLALALALAVTPLAGAELPRDTGELVAAAVQEVAVGASLGFVTYLVFAAVQAAGDLIDVFGGFSLATAFDPLSQTANSVHGKLHYMLAMMLLFATSGHLLVVGGLLRSFDTLPVGGLWRPADAAEVVATGFGLFFSAAVQIALPLIGVLLLADLGLALLTKVAPQLNAIGIMFPAKIMLTLLMVGVSLRVLPDAVSRLVEDALAAMAALL